MDMPPKPRGKTTWKTVLAARDLRHNETSAEDLLWNELRGKRLHGLRFRRQHPIGHFVLDFFCVQIQLAVELDGCVHRQSDQAAYDEERTRFLQEQGIYVLRFRNEEVFDNLPQVLQKILEAASRPVSRPISLP
jgi:very-short-patch-repair endonuclease